MRPIIVPFQLGCCHETVRCVLCGPAPKPPTVELIRALIENYKENKENPNGRPFWVSFFGGAPPTDEMISACDGLPISVRIRPDLLTRAHSKRLLDAGATLIELDVLTFSNSVLKESGRTYRRERVLEMIAGLKEMGFRISVVFAPGLPGSSFQSCIEDANLAAPLIDFARIHPVLVLADARLRDMHMDGRYIPLALGEAVTVSAAVLDILEMKGVNVIRVGVQPGPDGIGRAVAGPRHSSLRELVEGRRALRSLQTLFEKAPVGSAIAIRCHPGDETRTRGPMNQNVRTLRADHALKEVLIETDPSMPRGEWRMKVLS